MKKIMVKGYFQDKGDGIMPYSLRSKISKLNKPIAWREIEPFEEEE